MSHALGGTPQLVKATVAPAHKSQPAKAAVVRRALHKPEPPARLAELRTPPPPDSQMLMILTQWNEELTPQRVVVTFTHVQRIRPVNVIQAKYAVVRTPMGWLVIEI